MGEAEALTALLDPHEMFSTSGAHGVGAYCVCNPSRRYEFREREEQHKQHRLEVLAAYVATEREKAAADALEEVRLVVGHWERTPALRRGTAAAEIRRALHRAAPTS